MIRVSKWDPRLFYNLISSLLQIGKDGNTNNIKGFTSVKTLNVRGPS